MKTSRSLRRYLGFLAAGCVLACSLGAEGLGKDEPSRKLVLFDGKTLEGWKKTGFSGAGEVNVEDGSIVMKAGSPMTGITTTRQDLLTTNYELSYEAMRQGGEDFFAAATFPVGASYLTFVNGGWGGTVTGLSSLNGADASENETTQFVKYQNKTWYRFRIRVTDQAIQCWVDDRSVVHIETTGLQLSTRIETRANQPLGFATYETTGAVRNVQMRSLTVAEIAAVKKPK